MEHFAAPEPNMKRWMTYAVAGLLALGAGYFASQLNHKTPSGTRKILEGGTALAGEKKSLPTFKLTDKNNQPLTNEQFKEHWSYLFFGYTHCPDVCPTALQNMAEMLSILDKTGANKKFQAIFISVDPERDNTQTLKTYVDYFDPRIVGASGKKAELDKLTQQLGIIYLRTENPDNPEQYLVDHSAQILVINPRGEFTAVLSPPHQPTVMADDLQRLRQAYND
jgi:protein SCO1/2